MPSRGSLAEVVRPPADDVLAEQVPDVGHDARVRQEVVDAAVSQVRRADRVTVAALGQHAGQQRVEVATVLGDLLLAENANPLEVAVAVERRRSGRV